MPRLGVDPEYRFDEELNLPSGLRSRSRSPHSYVGYLSKEEQERQDHQLALRLQEEADRENHDHNQIVEDTLAPEQIAEILGTSFDIPSRRSQPESDDFDNDVIILSRSRSLDDSVSNPHSPDQSSLSETEQEMYNGELTLLSEDEHNEENNDDHNDSEYGGETDVNHLEEQSDDDSDEEEEMHDSEGDMSVSDDSGDSNQSESSDSESSDNSDDDDRLGPLGLFNNILGASLGAIGFDLTLSDLERAFESRHRELSRESFQESDEEEEPDDTVIRSGDYGRCTICFEEVPYDPVGCLYCQQLIGCRRCVNRWYKAANRVEDTRIDFLGGHPPSNHKQCPLCRHEWAEQVEVTSIFLLRDD